LIGLILKKIPFAELLPIGFFKTNCKAMKMLKPGSIAPELGRFTSFTLTQNKLAAIQGL